MQKKTGITIAVIGFLGGASIIRSLMRTEIDMTYLVLGFTLLLIALVLFINQIRQI
jgi:hypothetical protein